MTVQDVFEFLNNKYPCDTACDFDNVGILVGDPNSEVNTAIIALDCTPTVIDEAIKNNCQLIITHHPIIFEPLKNVLADSLVYSLIKNGISVISMHTNLDIGENGVNDSLCKALGLESFEKVTAEDGYILNTATLPYSLSGNELAMLLKAKLGGSIKYIGANKNIFKILFCSGSGATYLREALNHKCDALITADVKHNLFLEAERLGIALFDAGHFNTEDVVVEPLIRLLSKKIVDIKFLSTHVSAINTI